jgi:hypothetical protein
MSSNISGICLLFSRVLFNRLLLNRSEQPAESYRQAAESLHHIERIASGIASLVRRRNRSVSQPAEPLPQPALFGLPGSEPYRQLYRGEPPGVETRTKNSHSRGAHSQPDPVRQDSRCRACTSRFFNFGGLPGGRRARAGSR